VDNNRRQFLKILLVGGSTLVVGKVLGPLFSGSVTVMPKKNLSPFHVSDTTGSFSVYDDTGEEILQIDKAS